MKKSNNKKKKPLVTIVTATYNLIEAGRKETFLRMLRSIKEQSYNYIEHIIIDGASTDGTIEFLSENKVTFYSEPDTGLYNAMNKGIKKAKGDYILILNSDDYLNQHGLSETFNNSKFDWQDAIFCSINKIDSITDKKIATILPYKIDHSVYFTIPQPHPSTLYKKTVHDTIGLYNENYKIVSDWDFFLRFCENKSFTSCNFFHAINNFSTGGVSDSQSTDEVKKHLTERASVILKSFSELTKEQALFCAEMHWKAAEEIESYFSQFTIDTFSSKFIEALNDFYKTKLSLFEKEKQIEWKTIPISKEQMISNLHTLHPLECPAGENVINICMASDAGYEGCLYVAILTIIRNSSTPYKYNFYILDGGIKYKENFYDLQNKQISITFVDMTNQFISTYESRHLTKAAYYRLAIFLLFRDFNRVLYLDADSYILSDIAELFFTDLNGKKIGASLDSLVWQESCRNMPVVHDGFTGTNLEYKKTVLNFSEKKISKYFSSGVILFDIQSINCIERQTDLDLLLTKDFFTHDQDILNILFNEEDTHIISRAWNYFNIHNQIQECDFVLTEEIEKNYYYYADIEPKLISFIPKPWSSENGTCDFSNEYWDTLRETPYYDNEISKLKRKYSTIVTESEMYKFLFISFKITKRKTYRETIHIKGFLFGFLPLFSISEKHVNFIGLKFKKL